MLSSNKCNQAQDIRGSMTRFPDWTQNFWTWYTGKALTNQKPMFVLSPIVYSIFNICLLLSCIILNIMVVHYKPLGWLIWLVMIWVLTVSMAHVASTVVGHHCMHGRLTGSRKIDKLVAHAISILLFTQNPDEYHGDHLRLHHHKKYFATLADPTVKQLIFLGFKPGTSSKKLYIKLLLNFISLKFHSNFIMRRLYTNLISAKKMHCFIAYFYLITVVAFIYYFAAYEEFILAVFLPLGPLYHISSLLEYLSEHAWFREKNDWKNKKSLAASYSWGRFCGDLLPDKNLPLFSKLYAWSWWIVRAIFYHLPMRLMVVPGDLAQHDYHHKHITYQWTVAAYARQADLDSKNQGVSSYSEIWGINNAVSHVFDIISHRSSKLDEVSHET